MEGKTLILCDNRCILYFNVGRGDFSLGCFPVDEDLISAKGGELAVASLSWPLFSLSEEISVIDSGGEDISSASDGESLLSLAPIPFMASPTEVNLAMLVILGEVLLNWLPSPIFSRDAASSSGLLVSASGEVCGQAAEELALTMSSALKTLFSLVSLFLLFHTISPIQTLSVCIAFFLKGRGRGWLRVWQVPNPLKCLVQIGLVEQ